MFHVPEKYRITKGQLATTQEYGNNGAFSIIKSNKAKTSAINIIASDGDGWEHVSVSIINRCPTWEEMCFVKHLFWDAEDLVIQLHPPQTDWVNNHPYCLHLWRKAGTNDFCERPPNYLV